MGAVTDPRSVLDRPAPDAPATLTYAPGPAGVIDLWAPVPPDRAPTRDVLVALVHGGFWRPQFDRTHLRPLANSLAAQGFHVASVEYPRPGMPGGGWPGTLAAVEHALRLLLSATDLPPTVVAVGHSAGGHLAVSAAAPGRVPGLAGVVALAGVLDLHLAARLDLDRGAATALLGSAPTLEPARWAAADPARQRLTVPAVLIHGDADEQVPVEVSRAYLASRTPADAPCRLLELPGVEHFGLIDPLAPPFATLLSALAELTT